MTEEIKKLLNEDVKPDSNCNLCKEASLKVGENTGYGAIVYKIGNIKNGWFATLSPKTGGNPELDFTIQLMPVSHLTHFSQVNSHANLGKNYGDAFSRLCEAMTTILMRDQDLKANAYKREQGISIATYGKSTTWNSKKEHLHIKIFPFRGNIGQPYTVDSSFGKKEVFKDENGKEFVKMDPVRKVIIPEKRFNQLVKNLIKLLK